MTTQTPLTVRPPIVAVLGHVDHGKTTLLDTIRKTSVASREHGGITQHIGAYQIIVPSPKSKDSSKEQQKITFIDTPGHEAFAKMRSRGASAADIALLVVAADDSVKPQTKESIEQIKAAGVSLIVVVNKIDLPAANVDKVRQDLAKHGVQVEGFGGDVPMVTVSAKSGKGIPELLDMILLVAEMKELVSESASALEAVVVETRIDKGKGMVATIIVKKGTLRSGMSIYAGNTLVAKVRALGNEHGVRLSEAYPSDPVEVLGFTQLPAVGAILTDIQQEVQAPLTSSIKTQTGLPDFLKPVSEQAGETLKIVLKADTAGSLEAVMLSLDPKITVVSSGVGQINDADIFLAKATKSFVIGFNVTCPGSVAKLAETEKVVHRTYTIIYELLQELAEVVAGMKEVLTKERELGAGKIIAEFPFEGQRVAGTRVLTGRIARGDSVKLMRGDIEIARGKIKSLRKGKEDMTKLEAGNECGVLFDRKLDFLVGDGIIPIIEL